MNQLKRDQPFLHSEKTFLLSEFFPAKIFSCSERFPFSKIPEKILAGKNSLSKKVFSLSKKGFPIKEFLEHSKIFQIEIFNEMNPPTQLIRKFGKLRLSLTQ